MTTAARDSTLKCPKCERPLTYVRTVWRAFEPNIDVWARERCQRIVHLPGTEARDDETTSTPPCGVQKRT